MCFFGGKTPEPPAVQPPPTPAPPPVITPSEVSPQAAGEARKQRLDQLRYGFASTIKNTGGAAGVLDTSNAPGAGKQKLG